MPIKIETIVTAALWLIFFACFKGGFYFLANRTQELALALTLTLFLGSSFAVAFKQTNLSWSLWFFTPLALLFYFMLVPSLTWSQFTGASILPSIAASREFIILLLCPTLIFLIHLGYPIEKISSLYIKVAVFVSLSYVFWTFAINEEAYYYSGNTWKQSLVTADNWRGYRLKAPTLAMHVATIAAFIYLFRLPNFKNKIYWIGIILFLIYDWMLAQARSETAMVIIGVILYHLWFAKRNRLGVFLTTLVICVPFILFASGYLFEHLSQAAPADKTRYYSYMKAFDAIAGNPLFGVGQGSFQSISEGDVFGKFSSQDLGIFGITFKYGTVGAFIYYISIIYVFKRAVQAHLHLRETLNAINILLIIAMMRFTREFFLIMLSVDYSKIYGIGLLAITLAVSNSYLCTKKSSTN